MRLPWCACLMAMSLLALAGCDRNPFLQQAQNPQMQQQQYAMQQRERELQARATTLDEDNQEMQSMLAQTRQQTKLLEDQLVAVREQLATATTQLSQLRDEKQFTERQAEALVASTKRRGGATITANSSFQRSLPAINLPGVLTRQDGDVVRIELPADRLFQPGTSTLQPTASLLLDNCTSEIARLYPDHLIGVEGHTDNTVLRGSQGGDNHSLSTARALAVYQYFTARGRFPAQQLFTAGHGPNHPVVSNATAAGKSRNNRVELVIYPEKKKP